MEYDLRQRAEIVKLAQEVAKSLKAQPLIDYFEQPRYECPCGHTFEEGLGKYGCPNCGGEHVAVLK